MRIIALIDDDSLGLKAENEILGVSEIVATALIEVGYARKYNDTKPMVGKSVNMYEIGFSYPPNRQVFKNDSIYISNCITSTVWTPIEWDILVTGKNAI